MSRDDPGRPAAPTLPASVSGLNLWDLGADPVAIQTAAQAWRDLAGAADDNADDVDDPAQRIYEGPWAGRTADGYHDHRKRLTGDMRGAASLARRAADALDAVATELSSAQEKLTTRFDDVSSQCPATVGEDGSVTFDVAGWPDAWALSSAISRAHETRLDLDEKLVSAEADLSEVYREFEAITSAWRPVTESPYWTGHDSPYPLPDEAPRTGVIVDPVTGQLIVNAGPGEDEVSVSVDPLTGGLVVTVVTRWYEVDTETLSIVLTKVTTVAYPVPDGMAITIRGGPGRDWIVVDPAVQTGITILGGDDGDAIDGGSGDDRILGGFQGDMITGGAGDDHISSNDEIDWIDSGAGDDLVHAGNGDDFVIAGSGRDSVAGGAGQDYIFGGTGVDSLHGGANSDTIYGGGGGDLITAGTGQRDFADGGTGDDTMHGGAGNDTMSGGRGDDTIVGGTQDDTLVAGAGRDTIDGGAGADRSYAQTDDRTDNSRVVAVELAGDPGVVTIFSDDADFIQRVHDDLDTLRSIPDGRRALDEMDAISAGRDTPLVIIEGDPGNGAFYPGQHLIAVSPYPIRELDNSPSAMVLAHEMAHAYDDAHGIAAPGEYSGRDEFDSFYGTPNLERQAVGLTITVPGQPEQIDPNHPVEVTENSIRDTLGWPAREHYGPDHYPCGCSNDFPPSPYPPE